MIRDHWTDDARCKGKSTLIFFPAYSPHDNRWQMARDICAECTVKEQCLALVLRLEDTDDKWGMFGGLTPEQRRDIRKEQRAKL